ncbi:MAG: hypothetical protein ACLRRK_12780, partial [Parasutterella sp.]
GALTSFLASRVGNRWKFTKKGDFQLLDYKNDSNLITLGKLLSQTISELVMHKKKVIVVLDVPQIPLMISLKYANGLRNGANSDTHRCKQLTEHGEERCIKLREVAGFSAVRTIFQIVGPRKILHCLLGK